MLDPEALPATARPGSPGSDDSAPSLRAAPSSPSNSNSSEFAEPPSEAAVEAASRPKRCKISRAQLSVLIESFDQEPLPNFDQRQSLAQRLGMTPRSVQIWFQNRRQRLKPAAAQTRKDGLSRSASYGDSSHLRKALEGEQHRSGLSQSGAYQRGSHPALNAALNSIPALAAAAAAGLGQHDDVYYRLPPYASSGQTTGSSSYSITFDHSAPLDVMDKFAATKALLGAGYHPPAVLLAAQRAANAAAAAGPRPTVACCRTATQGFDAGLGGQGGYGAAQGRTPILAATMPPSPSSAPAAPPPATSDGLGLLLLAGACDAGTGGNEAGAADAGSATPAPPPLPAAVAPCAA